MHTFSFSSKAVHDGICGHNFSVLVIASAVLENHLLAGSKACFLLWEVFFCFVFFFLSSPTLHCHEERCSLSDRHLLSSNLFVKNVTKCVTSGICAASCGTLPFAFSSWPLKKSRSQMDCACVRAVATGEETSLAEEPLDLAFKI